ncbi:DUF3226 domain-containing protein [Elstera cyanobacteriorum]|uniref:DUF3226 domain-containing protein n=1 Tax=Elstera cyanobacteriorum TaxID=2022747 RepID=UPI0023F36E58|nr:DUF3226 domain-containing protein [Elstera cyanobacteriorum]
MNVIDITKKSEAENDKQKSMPTQYIGKKLLIIVEGKDDVNFIRHAIKDVFGNDNWLNASEMLEIGVLNGKDNLKEALRLLKLAPIAVKKKIEQVLIVLDADRGCSDTIRGAERQITQAGFKSTLKAYAWSDLTGDNYNGSVSVAIIPPESDTGNLESMALGMPRHPKLVELASSVYQDAATFHTDNGGGPLNDESKRKARIYLNLFPADVQGVGRAFEKGAFQLAQDQIPKLIELLKQTPLGTLIEPKDAT